MTDNELKKWNKEAEDRIIKALKCCSAALMYDEKQSLYALALDLINRQKAEKETMQHYIDHLEAENYVLMEDKEKLKAEIERLQEVNDSFTDIGKLYSEIKAEAIKEFAERVNKEAENILIDRDGFLYSDSDNTPSEIYDTVAEWCKDATDNIEEEMVGEENE